MNKSLIPNTITSLNLLSGCIGIVHAIQMDLFWAGWFIWFSAVLDFLDGFLARSLNAYSEIGKQLDSLSDLVSFGVLPATIMFSLMKSSTDHAYLPYLAFILAVFSAIRLAKFNIDTEQTYSFKGLPTPASAIFISGLIHFNFVEIHNFTAQLVITLALSLLMVSNFPLMAMKFRNYSWKDNWYRYIFLILSILLLIILELEAIIPIMIIYLLISLFVRNKSHESA